MPFDQILNIIQISEVKTHAKQFTFSEANVEEVILFFEKYIMSLGIRRGWVLKLKAPTRLARVLAIWPGPCFYVSSSPRGEMF